MIVHGKILELHLWSGSWPTPVVCRQQGPKEPDEVRSVTNVVKGFDLYDVYMIIMYRYSILSLQHRILL